jgi:hypothetical protein
MTPDPNDVPDELIVAVASPGMISETEVGGHPALPVYRTENVKLVLVPPDPGVALPALRLLCRPALAQFAAATPGAEKRDAAAAIASAMTRPAPPVATRWTRESRITRCGPRW